MFPTEIEPSPIRFTAATTLAPAVRSRVLWRRGGKYIAALDYNRHYDTYSGEVWIWGQPNSVQYRIATGSKSEAIAKLLYWICR